MQLNNKTYDTLKWVLTIVVPAVIALISGFGDLYAFDATKVITSISLVSTFVGAIFMVSSSTFKKEDDNHDN